MNLTAEEIGELEIEGKVPSTLEIINRGKKLKRFLEEGGGILVIDGSADGIMSADDMHSIMDSGSVMFTTESVTREIREAKTRWFENGYGNVFGRLNEDGCILCGVKEGFPEELRIFRGLSRGLGKYHARHFFIANRFGIYKMMHTVMEDMLKKYFCADNKRKDANRMKDLMMKMIIHEDWFSRLDKRESEILRCMGYNSNTSPARIGSFSKKFRRQYREYIRSTPKLLAGMGMDSREADEFSSRYRDEWRRIFISSMRSMLSEYITTMYMEMKHDGSLKKPGVDPDYSNFWDKPGNRGRTRQKSMRMMTKRAADRFCSGFDNDIELLIVGRYMDFNTEYPVALCSMDNDMLQFQRMRDALPY